ncbi:hypothetical protein PLICRDRAFT_42327 [Plicaturopsis crispa FD-325 SS-3]|nr:hypothetical protein PLICRDRAFT_42327 [Plicaturopsis crispa FD-325 SS-3]
MSPPPVIDSGSARALFAKGGILRSSSVNSNADHPVLLAIRESTQCGLQRTGVSVVIALAHWSSHSCCTSLRRTIAGTQF